MKRITRDMPKYLLLVLMGLALCLGGCGKSQQPAKTPPQKPAAQKPAAKAGPAEEAKEEQKTGKEVYEYDQKGRRDPFASLVQVAKEKPKRLRGTKPIENFDVDEIKLIAILWDSKQYYALITLPDGKSYTIRKGTVLGLYGGKVEEITKDSVMIREQVKDYRGQPKTKDTILKLRKEGE